MAGMTPLVDCVISFSQCVGAEKDSLAFLAKHLGARYVVFLAHLLSWYTFVLTYWRAFKLEFGCVSLYHLWVMCSISMWWLKVGEGKVLLDGCLANVNAVGINAYLPGEGIFKADTWAIIEYCSPKHYSLPCALWLIYSFSIYISLFLWFSARNANVKRE